MQMQGAAKAERAQNETNQLELNRQKGYQEQSFNLFDKSLDYNQGDTQQGREAKQSADLNSKFQEAADNVFSGAGVNGNSPNSLVAEAPSAIGDVYKKSMDEARGSIQNMLTAKAALGGFNRMLGNTSLQNQNITNEQTPIGGYMRGSMGVLPLELQKASHAGDSAKNMGTIIALLGSAAGMGASAMAAGAGAGAASAAGTGAGTAVSDGSMAAMSGLGGGMGYVHPAATAATTGAGSGGIFSFLRGASTAGGLMGAGAGAARR
jgi:hypothetical protein